MEGIWYAVQEERFDAWDYGSEDWDTAVNMLREQGHGMVSVIDTTNLKDPFCLGEIPYIYAVEISEEQAMSLVYDGEI